MIIFSDTWLDLFTLSGLMNPFALLIGAYMGWRADAAAQLWIAGFAAATLSLLFEAALGLLGLPSPVSQDAGALAMFPFRFVAGGLLGWIAYQIRSRV